MATLDCKTVRIFVYSSSASSQTEGWNEAENGERDWGQTPYGRVRLARFARVRLLRHALPISLLILRKKTDCFAVYGHTGLTRHLTVIRILTLGKVKYYELSVYSSSVTELNGV